MKVYTCILIGSAEIRLVDRWKLSDQTRRFACVWSEDLCLSSWRYHTLHITFLYLWYIYFYCNELWFNGIIKFIWKWFKYTFFFNLFLDCKINVHKRCKKNVANSCGINPKEFAKVIRDIGLTPDTRKKVNIKVSLPFLVTFQCV